MKRESITLNIKRLRRGCEPLWLENSHVNQDGCISDWICKRFTKQRRSYRLRSIVPDHYKDPWQA
jgi:5-hydroxyisourate hydrolase-like protein (transthyretin family)